jgi:hypothetical protein
MAVNEKLIKVVKFMIALKPVFLNESWIQEEAWPVSIYHRPDILHLIQKTLLWVGSEVLNTMTDNQMDIHEHPKVFSHNFIVLQFSKKKSFVNVSPIRLFCHKYIETKHKSAKSDCVINSCLYIIHRI